MKINRKKLLDAVKVASKLTGGKTNFPVLTSVMLDGAGQKLMATDLEMFVNIPLEISDYTRVTETVGVEGVTGEDGVDGLKGPQLRALAEDYGIPLPGKATVSAMRETIVDACRNAGTEESSWDENFCIPARDFGKILGTLEEEEVEITMSEDVGGTLFNNAAPRVRIGSNFSDLATFDPEEFPGISDAEVDPGNMARVTVNRKDLANVSVAAAKDSDRGFQLGIAHFDLSDREKPCVVSTDGHRMHWTTLNPDKVEASEGVEGFSMPLAAVKMLKSVFADEDDITVEHNNGSNRMSVRFGEGGVLSIRGVEGKFPDWKRVVPQESARKVTIVKSEMQKPLEQALTITGDKYSGFRLKFNGGVDVEFTNPEKGAYQKISIPIKAKNYPNDEETLIGINGRFVLDAMAPIGTDDIDLMFDDHSKPMCMGHENYHALVMPMRV